ncbi:MAG TPA: type II toxin-antitoxin system VapC family toxin [Gammaproteobacteria bacterium]|nr:type II toxin-antitoxin system VapC family toxin [Gammaproteobacteria bacterium]
MSLLLDTRTFIYLISEYQRVPPGVLARMESSSLVVSTLCLWEMLIKAGKGRLRVDTEGSTLTDFWLGQCEALELNILPIDTADVRHLEQLPDFHKDPFDRLLICQAIEHGLAIVTPDSQIRGYPVKTLWD